MKSEIVFRRTDTAQSVECCAVCHQGIDGSLTVAENSLGRLKAEELLSGSSYLFKEESKSSVPLDFCSVWHKHTGGQASSQQLRGSSLETAKELF